MSIDFENIDLEKLSDEELISLKNSKDLASLSKKKQADLIKKIDQEIARRQAVADILAGKPLNIR